MQRASTVLGAAVLFLVVAHAQNQRPDFSGRWSPDTEKTLKNLPLAGGATGGRGWVPGGRIDMTVLQDATALTVIRQTPAGELKIVYRFDGAPTRGEGPTKVRAKWESDKLLIETTSPDNPPRVSRSAIYLEGSSLVLEEHPFFDNDLPVRKNYYKRLR